jgi:hypothetical protein
MLREQTQQLDTGIAGAADDSDLKFLACHGRHLREEKTRAYCKLRMKKPPLRRLFLPIPEG